MSGWRYPARRPDIYIYIERERERDGERQRETEREREGERETERQRDRERVCVFELKYPCVSRPLLSLTGLFPWI